MQDPSEYEDGEAIECEGIDERTMQEMMLQNSSACPSETDEVNAFIPPFLRPRNSAISFGLDSLHDVTEECQQQTMQQERAEALTLEQEHEDMEEAMCNYPNNIVKRSEDSEPEEPISPMNFVKQDPPKTETSESEEVMPMPLAIVTSPNINNDREVPNTQSVNRSTGGSTVFDNLKIEMDNSELDSDLVFHHSAGSHMSDMSVAEPQHSHESEMTHFLVSVGDHSDIMSDGMQSVSYSTSDNQSMMMGGREDFIEDGGEIDSFLNEGNGETCSVGTNFSDCASSHLQLSLDQGTRQEQVVGLVDSLPPVPIKVVRRGRGKKKKQQPIEEEDWGDEPLSYELYQGYRILRELMTDVNRSINWPFINKVDPEASDAFDYYDRVKDPIWLNKMKEKFRSREYKTITQFVADMRLMLENCYRYNGPDHSISKKAQKMETVMEQKLGLLSRDLREKTSIAATKGEPVVVKQITGTRKKKALLPHDSSALLSQLRHEQQERVKENRKQQIADRKQAQENYLQEMVDWEENLLKDVHMEAMWELPQIGLFLFLANNALNLGEVMQYELERGLAMPRESTTLQRVMTSLLSTPYQRTRLDQKPPMPYSIWEEKVQVRIRYWFKILYDNKLNVKKTIEKVGIEERFFEVVGIKNPLDRRRYHELSYYQRVWILKGLCDYCIQHQESVREAIEAQPIIDQRHYLVGTDAEGSTYLHFPQFCGADVRIYRQSPLVLPELHVEKPPPPKKTPAKSRSARKNPPRKKTPIKREKTASPTPDLTPRYRDSRLRQNPRPTARKTFSDSSDEEDEEIVDKNCTDSGISENETEEEPQAKTPRVDHSNTSTPCSSPSHSRSGRSRESTPLRTLRGRLKSKLDTASPESTPASSCFSTPRGFTPSKESFTSDCKDVTSQDDASNMTSNEGDVEIPSQDEELSRDHDNSDADEKDDDTLVKPCDTKSMPAKSADEDSKSLIPECSQTCINIPDSGVMNRISVENDKHDSNVGDNKDAPSDLDCVSGPECDLTVKSEIKTEDDEHHMEHDSKKGILLDSEIKTKDEEQHMEHDSKEGILLESDKLEINNKNDQPQVKQEPGNVNSEMEAGKACEAPEVKNEVKIEEDIPLVQPELGPFELVVDSVEALRSFTEKFADPEAAQGDTTKTSKPRKKCVVDLYERLRYVLSELEPWEQKLMAANKKARLKIRKEKETYVEEPPKEEIEDVWESEESQSESSGDEETQSNADSVHDHSSLSNRSIENDLPGRHTPSSAKPNRTPKIKAEKAKSMDINEETEFGISMKGRQRKRRIIPDNIEEPGIKLRKKPQETSKKDGPKSSRLPNILQKNATATTTASPASKGPTFNLSMTPTSLGSLWVNSKGQTLLVKGLSPSQAATNPTLKDAKFLGYLTNSTSAPVPSPSQKQGGGAPQQKLQLQIKSAVASPPVNKPALLSVKPAADLPKLPISLSTSTVDSAAIPTSSRNTSSTSATVLTTVTTHAKSTMVSSTTTSPITAKPADKPTPTQLSTGKLVKIVPAPQKTPPPKVSPDLSTKQQKALKSKDSSSFANFNVISKCPPAVVQHLLKTQEGRLKLMAQETKTTACTSASTSVVSSVVSESAAASKDATVNKPVQTAVVQSDINSTGEEKTIESETAITTSEAVSTPDVVFPSAPLPNSSSVSVPIVPKGKVLQMSTAQLKVLKKCQFNPELLAQLTERAELGDSNVQLLPLPGSPQKLKYSSGITVKTLLENKQLIKPADSTEANTETPGPKFTNTMTTISNVTPSKPQVSSPSATNLTVSTAGDTAIINTKHTITTPSSPSTSQTTPTQQTLSEKLAVPPKQPISERHKQILTAMLPNIQQQPNKQQLQPIQQAIAPRSVVPVITAAATTQNNIQVNAQQEIVSPRVIPRQLLSPLKQQQSGSIPQQLVLAVPKQSTSTAVTPAVVPQVARQIIPPVQKQPTVLAVPGQQHLVAVQQPQQQALLLMPQQQLLIAGNQQQQQQQQLAQLGATVLQMPPQTQQHPQLAALVASALQQQQQSNVQMTQQQQLVNIPTVQNSLSVQMPTNQQLTTSVIAGDVGKAVQPVNTNRVVQEVENPAIAVTGKAAALGTVAETRNVQNTIQQSLQQQSVQQQPVHQQLVQQQSVQQQLVQQPPVKQQPVKQQPLQQQPLQQQSVQQQPIQQQPVQQQIVQHAVQQPQVLQQLVVNGQVVQIAAAAKSTQSFIAQPQQVVMGSAIKHGSSVKQVVVTNTAQLQAILAANQKQIAIDNAVKTVLTTVSTTLPTAQIKVSSPFVMPTTHRSRPVTITTSAMKSPIPAVPQLPTKARNTSNPIALSSSTTTNNCDPPATTSIIGNSFIDRNRAIVSTVSAAATQITSSIVPSVFENQKGDENHVADSQAKPIHPPAVSSKVVPLRPAAQQVSSSNVTIMPGKNTVHALLAAQTAKTVRLPPPIQTGVSCPQEVKIALPSTVASSLGRTPTSQTLTTFGMPVGGHSKHPNMVLLQGKDGTLQLVAAPAGAMVNVSNNKTLQVQTPHAVSSLPASVANLPTTISSPAVSLASHVMPSVHQPTPASQTILTSTPSVAVPRKELLTQLQTTISKPSATQSTPSNTVVQLSKQNRPIFVTKNAIQKSPVNIVAAPLHEASTAVSAVPVARGLQSVVTEQDGNSAVYANHGVNNVASVASAGGLSTDVKVSASPSAPAVVTGQSTLPGLTNRTGKPTQQKLVLYNVNGQLVTAQGIAVTIANGQLIPLSTTVSGVTTVPQQNANVIPKANSTVARSNSVGNSLVHVNSPTKSAVVSTPNDVIPHQTNGSVRVQFPTRSSSSITDNANVSSVSKVRPANISSTPARRDFESSFFSDDPSHDNSVDAAQLLLSLSGQARVDNPGKL